MNGPSNSCDSSSFAEIPFGAPVNFTLLAIISELWQSCSMRHILLGFLPLLLVAITQIWQDEVVDSGSAFWVALLLGLVLAAYFWDEAGKRQGAAVSGAIDSSPIWAIRFAAVLALSPVFFLVGLFVLAWFGVISLK